MRVRAILLVAWIRRVDNADNDQGPNPSAQHDNPREIQVRKAPRKRSGQVHVSKPLFTFWGSMLKLTISCNLIVFYYRRSIDLPGANWRIGAGGTSPLNWGRARYAEQLAAHPPTQLLSISTMPAPPGIAEVGW